jgi:hypothetical protein
MFFGIMTDCKIRRFKIDDLGDRTFKDPRMLSQVIKIIKIRVIVVIIIRVGTTGRRA